MFDELYARDVAYRLSLGRAPEGLADVVVSELDAGPVSAVDGLGVQAAWMDHDVPALGYRIEHGGRAVVVSGDTAPCDGLRELAHGADLLVVDACLDPTSRAAHSASPERDRIWGGIAEQHDARRVNRRTLATERLATSDSLMYVVRKVRVSRSRRSRGMADRRSAVAKALDLLTTIGGEPDGQRLTDLADRVGLNPSTAHRTLAELVSSGFVARGPDDRYRPGPAFLTVVGSASALGMLRLELGETLEPIVERTGFMANAQVLRGTDSHVLEAVRPPRYRSLQDFRGQRIPSWQAAGGRVLLAQAGSAVVEQVARRVALEEGEAASESMLADLAEIRRVGYAHTMGSLDAVIGAVAVPVVDPTLGCVLALTAVGLISELDPDTVGRLVDELTVAAARLVPIKVTADA